MQYSPLAIKYRPKIFSEVIGHEMVTKVLSQAILNNRLGPAIIFYGTRGVGKTTFARIVARSLMCANPNPDPCGVCEFCTQNESNIQLDLIEMDAASHTGVDDVREIIETCKYQPNVGKYKIFIIDEVHMLSKSAFNALLKTLEEPPSHVKFIMATTELYRVPETVLSRCLRFDLKKIATHDIAQYLSLICNRENIKYDIESINAIAKFARGSMRDALSTLDKVINANVNIQFSDVSAMLGVVNESALIDLIQNICKSDVSMALLKGKVLFEDAQDSATSVINSLLDILHYMTCLKLNANILVNINYSDDAVVSIQEIVKNVTVSNLTRMWQMVVNASRQLQFCEKGDLILDMLIMSLCYGSHVPDLYDILSKNNSSQFLVNNQNSPLNNKISENNDLASEILKKFPDAVIE